MDAIDSALVQFKCDQSILAEYQQYPMDRNTQERLRSISATTPIEEIEQLDTHLGVLFADAVKALIHRANIDHELVTAIGSHGQTVLHEPNTPEPFSLQIGNPNLIAYKTGITTVADFRGLDIAAGGQGAPLVPAFHQFQFQHPEKNRVILNIGGMANITILPADSSEPVSGFDTGPGNVLMDEWIKRHQEQLMDHNGHWATTGTPQADLLTELMGDPYFHAHPPKTTGRDYFNLSWLEHYLTRLENRLKPADVQATLLALTAKTIADAILNYAPKTEETLLCGGGVHNEALIDEIEKILSGCTIGTTDMEGLDPDCIEAITFAWLAKCRIEGNPGNLPSVTGAKSAVVLGAIYEPGNK